MYSISKFATLALIQYSKSPPKYVFTLILPSSSPCRAKQAEQALQRNEVRVAVLYGQLESCSQTRLMEWSLGMRLTFAILVMLGYLCCV